MTSLARWFSCIALLPMSGCALHYYDARSGTEHVWGFGHLKMKVTSQAENLRAVVKGTETVGLAIGAGRQDYYAGLGWESRRQIIIENDSAVRLEWPDTDFYNVRIGSKPPFETNLSPQAGSLQQ